MNRVKKRFAKLKASGRCGLVAYVTCGDPDVDTTFDIVKELERAGADCVELGIPFSDPIADGPVIQAAAFRALQRGTTMVSVFDTARRIRESSEIPLVAFTYLNPILRYGIERFADDAKSAGFDSVLITDLPPESSKEIRDALVSRGLGSIFLLAPTSPPKRIATVDRLSDGFVYYISTTGVTGARRDLDADLVERLDSVRASLKKPLAVGFGISRHEHYEALAPHCDAVVVGSAIVRAIADGDRGGAARRAGDLVREILGRTS